VSDAYDGGRPIGVTLLSVLAVVIGVVDVVVGLLLIVTRDNREVEASAGASAEVLLVIGIAYIVVGAIYLAVARGLWHGNNGSRVIVNVVAVINLATALWLLTQSTGTTRVQAAISIVLALVLLGIVNTGRAKAYFLAR
jgi:drug/metabolite transporter (DMT)-like permease